MDVAIALSRTSAGWVLRPIKDLEDLRAEERLYELKEFLHLIKQDPKLKHQIWSSECKMHPEKACSALIQPSLYHHLQHCVLSFLQNASPKLGDPELREEIILFLPSDEDQARYLLLREQRDLNSPLKTQDQALQSISNRILAFTRHPILDLPLATQQYLLTFLNDFEMLYALMTQGAPWMQKALNALYRFLKQTDPKNTALRLAKLMLKYPSSEGLKLVFKQDNPLMDSTFPDYQETTMFKDLNTTYPLSKHRLNEITQDESWRLSTVCLLSSQKNARDLISKSWLIHRLHLLYQGIIHIFLHQEKDPKSQGLPSELRHFVGISEHAWNSEMESLLIQKQMGPEALFILLGHSMLSNAKNNLADWIEPILDLLACLNIRWLLDQPWLTPKLSRRLASLLGHHGHWPWKILPVHEIQNVLKSDQSLPDKLNLLDKKSETLLNERISTPALAH